VLHHYGVASMQTPKRDRSRPIKHARVREGNDPISFIRPDPKECTGLPVPLSVTVPMCAPPTGARFREIAAAITPAHRTT
jgi:hypothetical protein